MKKTFYKVIEVSGDWIIYPTKKDALDAVELGEDDLTQTEIEEAHKRGELVIIPEEMTQEQYEELPIRD